MMMPPRNGGLPIQVWNPGGRRLEGEVIVKRGNASRSAKVLLSGQPVLEVVVEKVPPTWLQQGVELELTDQSLPADSRPVLTSAPLTLQSFNYSLAAKPAPLAVVEEGDPKVKAKFSMSEAKSPAGFPGQLAKALQINYEFPKGWKYIVLKTMGRTAMPMPGVPRSIGVWVHGDGSGNLLRMRFQDSTGQTFQPDHGPIDWKGWKFVLFSLDNANVGRWGGAEDGVIHYPIRIDAPVLVDSAGALPSKGTIYVTGMFVVSESG
jgi:polysaccharide biosynthesis protein PslG